MDEFVDVRRAALFAATCSSKSLLFIRRNRRATDTPSLALLLDEVDRSLSEIVLLGIVNVL